MANQNTAPQARGEVTVRNPIGLVTAGLLPLYETTTLNYLNNMPFADYAEKFQGRIMHARDHRRRDTRVVAAASTILKKVHKFFDAPKDSTSEKSLDGSITIDPKDESFTNMVESSKIEAGSTLIVESVQVGIFQTHRDFNAFAAGTGEPSDATPAATDTLSATNVLIGLCRSAEVRFGLGRDVKAEGSPDSFPPDRGFSGALGGATPEGWIQIGFGAAKPMREIVVLQNLYHFFVEWEQYRALITPMNVEIEIALCGVLLESVG